MDKSTLKKEKRQRRHKRARAKIFGTAKMPRLYVFRSNRCIYAQLVNDEKGKILASASDKEVGASKIEKKLKAKDKNSGDEKQLAGKVALAFEIGKIIAQKALENKIEKVVFDRGGYKYHGRVKALADGAREGGLKF